MKKAGTTKKTRIMKMNGIEWLVNELDRRKLLEALDELDAEIIIALADYNLNATEVAKRLYMHRNTVRYHIKRVHRLTGKDALNFYDLCELLPIARQKCEID